MTYVSTVLADGAVGFWELAETSPGNATVATDAKGTQNGSYAGANWTNVTGIPGGGGATAVALTSSAAANKVTVATNATINLPDSGFSIEFWVKRGATQSAVQRLFGGPGSGTASIGFNATNTMYVEKSQTSTIANSSNTITDTTTWHHVVWTKAGATNHLYIDGTDVTSGLVNASVTTNAGWVIYENSAANNPPPSGLAMAMVAVYPTALSSGTVSAHYSAGSGTPPVNTVAPAVTGTTTVGSVLTSDTGTWTTVSPVYTYQWQRDVAGNLVFSNIGSATSSTYTLVDLDDGNKIRCVVTDTDAGGVTSANSNAVGLVLEPGVPVNTVAPAVTGTTTVGQVLTSTAGTFTNFSGSVHTTAYQWQRDAFGNSSYSNISSATSSTYTLVDADDACNIRCVVTATNDVGSSSGTNSNVVGTVIEPAATNSVVPALGGTNANVGAAITCSTGTWANMGGHNPTFTYQWRSAATSGGTYADIVSATSSSYTPVSGDLARFLKCVVTAHNTNASTPTATTVASNVVGAQAASGTAIFLTLMGAG